MVCNASIYSLDARSISLEAWVLNSIEPFVYWIPSKQNKPTRKLGMQRAYVCQSRVSCPGIRAFDLELQVRRPFGSDLDRLTISPNPCIRFRDRMKPAANGTGQITTSKRVNVCCVPKRQDSELGLAEEPLVCVFVVSRSMAPLPWICVI